MKTIFIVIQQRNIKYLDIILTNVFSIYTLKIAKKNKDLYKSNTYHIQGLDTTQ